MSEQVREWTWIDRKAEGWPSGEWDGEPDKAHWKDAVTGMDCLAVRHASSGHWCGYVGVPEGHPAFGRDYDDVRIGDDEWPDVHGGLTFADFCQETTGPERGVCHVPFPGDPDHIWWLGFDCAHSGDRSPRDAAYAAAGKECFRGYFGESYKPLGYVRSQCAKLAAQLAGATP